MKIKPRTLFGRAATTIAITLMLFSSVAMAAAMYFVYIPMSHRHADDFAAIIVSAAHSLQSLPESMHADLKQQLLEDHGLIVSEEPADSPGRSSSFYYYPFFSDALERRAGEELPIIESDDGPLTWVDIPAHGRIFRLGFDSQRLGINPPVVLVLIIICGAFLTLAASLLEVRRVTQPLEGLSEAAKKLARGHNPPPVPETGPEEIASLARTFNKLSSELQTMSENRTVMIASPACDTE